MLLFSFLWKCLYFPLFLNDSFARYTEFCQCLNMLKISFNFLFELFHCCWEFSCQWLSLPYRWYFLFGCFLVRFLLLCNFTEIFVGMWISFYLVCFGVLDLSWSWGLSLPDSSKKCYCFLLLTLAFLRLYFFNSSFRVITESRGRWEFSPVLPAPTHALFQHHVPEWHFF